MQTTFGVIMLAIVNGEPKTLTLAEMLSEYIKFQKDVVTRRTPVSYTHLDVYKRQG